MKCSIKLSEIHLLIDCRSLLGRFQHCKVQHVFCEVNRVANALTKLRCDIQENFVIMDGPPSNVVSDSVYSDAIGENFVSLMSII